MEFFFETRSNTWTLYGIKEALTDGQYSWHGIQIGLNKYKLKSVLNEYLTGLLTKAALLCKLRGNQIKSVFVTFDIVLKNLPLENSQKKSLVLCLSASILQLSS